MDNRDKTSRELEWFDLETRMRELIHNQLEPVVKKAREDREAFQGLKVYCKALENRLKSMETAVLGDQNAETIIENIYKRCAEIEGNRKKDTVRLDQNFVLINESVNSFNVEIQKFNERLDLLDTRDHERESEIIKTNQNIEANRVHVLGEIDKLSENFREMNRVYQEVAMKTEEQANIATAKAIANSIEMGNYKREIDVVRKDVVESLSMIKEVRSLKLNIDTFEVESMKVQNRFLELLEEIQKYKDELSKRDQFIDKYIPLQTVILISDYLYAIIDQGTKKKLADYENIALKDLNLKVLEGREVVSRTKRADQILNDMRHVEERKVEFQTKEIKSVAKGPNFAEIREKINIKKKNTFMSHDEPEVHTEAPPGLSKQEVEKIVQTALTAQLDPEIGRLKSEIKVKLEGFKNYLKSFNSESGSMQSHFVSELENLAGRLKLLKSDLLLEINDCRKDNEILKKDIGGCQNLINSLSQMVVCLFEYNNIEQALQRQDEEDRHNMALNMEKELQSELALHTPKANDATTLPSANFTFKKNCLSCGTSNSILSGFRTSIVYNPSSLIFRNKKFERHELLRIKAQMLRKCWDANSKSFNLKYEEIQQDKSSDKITEKSFDKSFDKSTESRPTRISRLNSIDEGTLETKETLPLLVSPSMRNRSQRKSKLVHKST
ncbi:hypothetical protein SteCoe_14195 [Stentor coeruleus]|uniref:Uncharacterized protein n=1 Tax=Stentor coeruleus TaxID=5963 RepID=A0A1R2C6M5_9CILI|nr:hypothetical protein SteCoe_14195 [Stentor coeruleus]